ncbi:hypothetical protein DQ04_01501000 [Trypanosoma grayi]|uniref:hypothetical protein n=1 Tax=Trypanosoma grayi TaxID=71804 RepID=UPI0004F49DEC|nr:hypothetical protein DQ04_01501000 [Trypanosoma grayi]KEG12691.1 hypothetical protein DQ04_01501000 [Trypanosoma grayi]
MNAEQQDAESRRRLRFTAEKLVDCPIGGVMSVPLDRLCQLAWPLLHGNGAATQDRPPRVPRVSQTDADDAQLARAINTTVAETIRVFQSHCWWGQLTCQTLRSALFQKALQSVRDNVAVIPQGQPADEQSPTAWSSAPQNTVTRDRRPHGGVEPVNQKIPRRPSESFCASDEISLGDSGSSTEKRKITSVSGVLSYVAGQQDEKWLSQKVLEMIDLAASPQKEGQNQLISVAASVSVQAQHHKRSARAFLTILQEVLGRWNAILDSNEEVGIFGFGIVVPILNITRCTIFTDDDMITVGHLLAKVKVPSRGCGLTKESLSIATFVTKYTLSLDDEIKSAPLSAVSSPSVLPMATGVPTNRAALLMRLPALDYDATSIASVVTEVFLVAPLARKVSVHVQRALCCEGVRIALVPRTPVSNDDNGSGINEQLIEPVCFEPHEGETHELTAGCDGVVRYMGVSNTSTTPVFEAEVRVETSLEVDGRWVVELRNTLSAAQLEVTSNLIQRVKNGFVSGDFRLRDDSLKLFRNGLLSEPRVEPLPPFVMDLLNLEEGKLRQRVPCRQSDVRGVRAALSLISRFLESYEPNQLSWQSRAWQDAIKRVSLVSSLLGKNPGATEMANFVLDHVAPCRLTVPQIVEGTIGLLTSDITVAEMRSMLAVQRARAKLCVVALSLLLRAKENFVPGDMFRVVCLLRDVMMYEGGHYLLRFQGCGDELEEEIRELLHRLLTSVFTALQRLMLLPEGERRSHGPHRFLWDADEFGPFALVSLSLLATPLDARDMDFIWCKIVRQVEGLLPNFTELTRTASFKVNEVEEGSMLESTRALVDNDDGGGGDDNRNADDADAGAADQPPVGLTLGGASERGIGMWVPSGRERVCCTSTPLYCPGAQAPMSTSASSFSALPSSLSAVGASFCAADVQLMMMPPRELVIALASEQQSSVTSSSIQDDLQGFYFMPHDGKLHHGRRQIALPPLVQGDIFTFCFSFSPKTSTRTLSLLVNGVRMAEFPSPQQRLFLVAGVMDFSSLRNNTFRVSFRSRKETTNSTCAAPASLVAMTSGGEGAVGALPTRHSIAMFATLVLFYMISFCARRLAHVRRMVAAGSTPQSISPTFAGGRGNLSRSSAHAEEAWTAFVDGCCGPLRANVESLIDSIKRLPPLSEFNDATERVKRNAASFVYHRFLMDHIIIIRTAIRCSSSPVEMLSTLAKVVCCEEVGERERCLALTAVCSALREPYRFFGVAAYNPLQLWECCRLLARQVSAIGYKPRFTEESSAQELGVYSGGRRIKSLLNSCGVSRSAQNTTSFAAQGIPLDGSLGEVSFSVRLQRGAEFDTLGRFYYIGVACPYPMSMETTLQRHPGERHEMAYVYAITDNFTDVSSPSIRTELSRHAKNWMSSEENIIYGSADVITVTVQTRLRCVSFARNGMPLGTLYTNIPSMVKVLFPFVELFNKDASAVWMHTPREIGIRARVAMREMLCHWGAELMPRLQEMIEVGDVVALEVLGADGDEMSFCYRIPPRSVMKGSRVVRLVRQLGPKAEVVMEGGTKSITIPAAALEPNYSVVISKDMSVSLLLNDLMHTVSVSVEFIKDPAGCSSVHVRRIKMFLCALRLLAEMELPSVLTPEVEAPQMLLRQLISILAVPDVIPNDKEHIVLEAWNEVTQLQDDDELWIPIPIPYNTDASGTEEIGDTDDAEEGADICLRCPTCDEEWGSCTASNHAAPCSLCATLHNVLHRIGVTSPFTGLACEWQKPEKKVCVTLRVAADGRVEGEGEDPHGIFSFTGKQVASNRVRGRCVYKCAENPTTGDTHDEEWACEVCTFINLPDSTRCAMCTTARPGATWTCMLCSYAFNSNNIAICMTCGHQRMGVAEVDQDAGKKRAYCEGCGKQKEYTKFEVFECRAMCERCERETRWLPDEKTIGVAEGTLVGAGDTMKWVVTFGSTKCVYADLHSGAYSLEGLCEAAEAASPGASDLSRYVPPLAQASLNDSDESLSAEVAAVEEPQQRRSSHHRSLVHAILLFCSRIVCRWGPELAPKQLARGDVLRRLRVLDDSWLVRLKDVPEEAARSIFSSCLRILLAGKSSEQVIWSLSSISLVVMEGNPSLQRQRHYLLYALCVNVARNSDSREVREVCYASLNALLEEACGQPLKAECLRDIVAITPVIAGQQRLMVHAVLRGVDVSISANVTATSWLIEAVERMGLQQRLPAFFDEDSPDTFPYLVELPDTRMGDGGELIVGQVRGSVGVFSSKGGRYYYEVVLPPNFNDRNKTIIMGWGTMQHEVLSSGQHVGSDIHSWGFNCQDRLRILTGEQMVSTSRPIVAGDVVGALLDLSTMMMCWSVNGEDLLWVAVSTQGKGEAIYPFVSASMDPHGVIVRLGNTQFKPEGYQDFSPITYKEARHDSVVDPRSYEFYVQLCQLGNDIVNCGFTVDSLLETTAWADLARASIHQYPLLCEEAAGSLERLRPYFQHLRSINALAVSMARSHDIFRNSAYLMGNYQKARQLLFFTARWAIVERQIDRRLIRSNVKRPREVLIDLNRAKAMAESSGGLDFLTLFDGSVAGQLFRQTKDSEIYLDSVMFVICLAGEVADDAGGVTRSVVTMMCDELNYRDEEDGRRAEPLLPFFKLSSHSTMVNVVPNMDFYRSNPEHKQLLLDFYTWLGKLLGNATISGYLMFSLTFPRLMWKFLTLDEPTIEDYHADIDDTVRGALNDDEFLLNDEFYHAIPGIRPQEDDDAAEVMSMMHSTRIFPALTPQRSSADINSLTNAEEFDEGMEVERRRKEAERALTHQYDELLLAVRTGITSVIPINSLQLIRWDDLQQRVCGSLGTTAEDVISSLNFALVSEELRQMLTEVVHGWTQKQRSQFLLFCSGQRRIPLPEKVQVSCGDDPNAIPTAHTCSPISLLLQPYASASVLREKLTVCLRHMYEFGFA